MSTEGCPKNSEQTVWHGNEPRMNLPIVHSAVTRVSSIPTGMEPKSSPMSLSSASASDTRRVETPNKAQKSSTATILAPDGNHTTLPSSEKRARTRRILKAKLKTCGHKKPRSKLVKGASNLSRETKLLRHRLDCLLDAFSETVVSVGTAQQSKVEHLRAERQELLARIEPLERQNLLQASELIDSDELVMQMEERRLASEKEASLWKEKCEALTARVEFLQEFATGGTVTQLENENRSLRLEITRQEITIRELGNKLFVAKMHLMGNEKENTIRADALESTPKLDDPTKHLLERPANSTEKRRRGGLDMGLHGSHHQRKFEF